MIETLLRHIESYVQLNSEEINALQNRIEVRTFLKNEVIFHAGEISHEIFLLNQGCVRLFYSVDGTDRTAFFFTEGQFICPGESFTYKTPAKESYQAIEETSLFVFDESVIGDLLNVSPKFGLIGKIATEQELIACQQMIASFVTRTAEERYLDLLETNSELFQRVPQQYIASFLGVAPETLSRIRKRLSLKNGS